MQRWFLMLILSILLMGCQSSNKDKKEMGSNKIKEPKQGAVNNNKSASSAKSKMEEQKKASLDFVSFPVYLDKGNRENHYIPSGFMPNGNCISFDDAWEQNCQSGKTCIRIQYDVACSRNDQKWAGIYWLNPANNWGTKKGGFNLTGAKKLVFWAKGEKGGEQIQEFTIGGITGDYPDTDTAVIGPVILTNDWQEYTVDLRGKDLSYISGGFSWTTNEEVNQEDCIFYLDNIRFE